MVKKGNFNRAPLGCFFKIYRYWYTDLLFEVKFYFVSEHLPDDSDKLAGTVSKRIVVRPAFSPLGIVISLEGCVTLYKSYKDFKEEEMELTYEYFEEDYHLSLMEDGNYLLVENATIQKI